LNLQEKLWDTCIDSDSIIDYNEGNDGTDESLIHDTDEVSQDETSKGIDSGLRNLQPSSAPNQRNDTQKQMEGNTWPNGPEPEEEVSKSMGTTSIPLTQPTIKSPERIGFGKVWVRIYGNPRSW
jgi:hypothetical protein